MARFSTVIVVPRGLRCWRHCFLWVALFGPRARTLDITVTVVDSNTGRAIPNAQLEIMTESYGIFDNHPRLFLATSDENGKLSFKQRIDYAISRVGVIAWDEQMKRRGVSSAEVYASDWFRSRRPFDPRRHVRFDPNRRHYRIEVKSLSEANGMIHGLREDNVWRAGLTRETLEEAGIPITQTDDKDAKVSEMDSLE